MAKTTVITDLRLTMIMDGEVELPESRRREFEEHLADVVKSYIEADDVNILDVKIFLHENEAGESVEGDI